MDNSSFRKLENCFQKVSNGIWVCPSDNASAKDTSRWLVCEPEPVLIDCPAITTKTVEELKKTCW